MDHHSYWEFMAFYLLLFLLLYINHSNFSVFCYITSPLHIYKINVIIVYFYFLLEIHELESFLRAVCLSNRKLPSPKNQIKMVTKYKLVYTQNRFLLTFFLHILEGMNMSPS